MRLFVTLCLLLFAAPLLAQTPGNCAQGTASADLDISDVRAALYNNGNLFYNSTTGAGYVVPKASGNTALYAANLWVGGTVGGELRTAAATFQNFEMWPGPLEEGATLPNPDDCSDYDRIWVVSAADILAYDDEGIATPDLAEWPVALGAEVVDGDGNPDNYDLAAGDRPRLYGSQTAFWVMNDVGNEHASTSSAPIGIEMQVTAFAVSSPEVALDQATLYRVKLVNRNTLALEDARTSVWVDTDLGAIVDELEGVDVGRGLGYYYNSGETDAAYGVPPAAGVDFLSDGLGSFMYSINGGPAGTVDPVSAEEFFNVQRGRWRDGTPLTASGLGYDTDGDVTVWAFSGDPVTGECWSATNPCNDSDPLPGQNTRMIPSSPDFTLQPGESKVFDLAYLFAQGEDNLDSITELRAASDLVQAAYDGGSLFDPVPVANEGGAAPSALGIDSVHPNPAREHATVNYSMERAGPVRLSVHDVLGREVAVLAEGTASSDTRRATFDTSNFASGVYFVVLETSGERRTRKLLVVR